MQQKIMHWRGKWYFISGLHCHLHPIVHSCPFCMKDEVIEELCQKLHVHPLWQQQLLLSFLMSLVMQVLGEAVPNLLLIYYSLKRRQTRWHHMYWLCIIDHDIIGASIKFFNLAAFIFSWALLLAAHQWWHHSSLHWLPWSHLETPSQKVLPLMSKAFSKVKCGEQFMWSEQLVHVNASPQVGDMENKPHVMTCYLQQIMVLVLRP